MKAIHSKILHMVDNKFHLCLEVTSRIGICGTRRSRSCYSHGNRPGQKEFTKCSVLFTIVLKTGRTWGRDDISTIIIIIIIIIIVYNCLQNRWDPGAWRSPPPWRAAVLETEALPSLGLKVST